MNCTRCKDTGWFREKLGVWTGIKSNPGQMGWKFGALRRCSCEAGRMADRLTVDEQ